MASRAPEEIAEMDKDRQEIFNILKSIPSNHESWSYQRAVDFKAQVKKSFSVANSQRATPESVRSALIELRHYYK